MENALSPSRPAAAPPHINHGEESSKPSTPTPAISADISRIIKYAPAQLIGREDETKLLNDAWAKVQNNEIERPRVLTFLALGGEGKTSLVAKWAADLARRNWPGCDAVFAWSFYSQGTREQVAASSDVFLKEALTFFGDAEIAGSRQGAFDKGDRLAQLAGAQRALLILDGLEPLQYAPSSPTPGELKDKGLSALLKRLAAHNKGLCVVTSRYSILDLRAYVGGTVHKEDLKRLSNEAGVALLRSLGVTGAQDEFETLVEDVKGHALTLNLLGSYLRDAYAGDIHMRDLVRLQEADEEQGGHAFRAMDAYVTWFERDGDKGLRALAMLRLMGLFDRPAEAGCLAVLWAPPAIAGITEPLIGLSEAQRNVTLRRLVDARLVTVIRDRANRLVSLDAHPLLREYFAKTLREGNAEGWRAAHRRLYENLCKTTPDKIEPTPEDLQPLYQAVVHGCRAGLQQEACHEVYIGRIVRHHFVTRNLGAYGSEVQAVACFFDTPWSRVSSALTEATRSWLLSQAAFRLRGWGRLTEALEPARAAVKMAIEQGNWSEAAIRAANLSGLELTLGEFTSAVADGKESVAFADRSGDPFQRMRFRTTYADALHQSGQREEALARFIEAEPMQAEREPQYRLLYSLQGFRYCDLLLADAERAAWRLLLQPSGGVESSSLIESCRAISDRAAKTIEIAQRKNWLLEIGLDHLTLARAGLYAAILALAKPDPSDPSREHMHQAMDHLRRADDQQYIPLGLLTRAILRCLDDDFDGAKEDLDEAFYIAERGQMPLHMADVFLHRARLFAGAANRPAQYPWTSPQEDLKEGRLIEKHGYGRRKEELEDAESAG